MLVKLLLLTSLFLMQACTGKNTETSKVGIKLPAQILKSTQLGTQSLNIVHVVINVSGKDFDSVICNWSLNGHEDNSADCLSTDSGEMTLEIPSGSDRLIQVLGIYAGSSGTLEFTYGDALAKLVNPVEEIPINLANLSTSAAGEGKVMGRYLTGENQGPTGKIQVRVKPHSDKPSMLIKTEEIFDGWFKVMMLDGVDFEYVLDDKSLLFGEEINLSDLRSPDSLSRLEIFIPTYESQRTNEDGVAQTEQKESETLILGYFGNGSENKKVCYESTPFPVEINSDLFRLGKTLKYSNEINNDHVHPVVAAGRGNSCAGLTTYTDYLSFTKESLNRTLRRGPFIADLNGELIKASTNAETLTIDWEYLPSIGPEDFGELEIWLRRDVTGIEYRSQFSEGVVCSELADLGFTLESTVTTPVSTVDIPDPGKDFAQLGTLILCPKKADQYFATTLDLRRHFRGETITATPTLISAGDCSSTSLAQDSVFSCTPVGTDPQGGPISYLTSTSHTCIWATVDPTSGNVNGLPGDNDVGTCDIAVQSTNGTGVSTELVFNLVITNVAPLITVADAPSMIQVNSGEIRSDADIQASEEGFGIYSFDNDGTTPSPAKCSDNADSLTIDPNSGAVSFDPTNSFYGFCNIKIVFTDSNGATAADEFSIEVTEADPPNPTALVASPLDDTQIDLSWNSGGLNTVDFNVYYISGASAPANCGAGTLADTTSSSSYSVTGLTPSTVYSFRVCAKNASGDESPGTIASATTLLALPPNPTSFAASNAGETQIDLSWASGGGTTTDYRVAYQTGASAPANCASATMINEASISGLSHSVTGLLSGTQYSFRLCAINADPSVSAGVTANATSTLPQLSIDDVTVTEGIDVVFTVSLSSASSQNVSINYGTGDTTAASPVDFAGASGTANITSGSLSTTVTVNTVDDSLDEATTEQFIINLSAPTNATISDGMGLATLNDNDAPPSISIGNVAVLEDVAGATMTFTITASAVSGLAINYDIAVSGGTATSSADYTATSTTSTIAAGATSQTYDVTIVDDSLVEAAETIVVSITSPVNASLGTAVGTGTINENDTPATLTITDGPTYDFGTQANGSLTAHTFTINNTGGVEATSIGGTGITAPYSFPSGFPGSGGNCGSSLAAGASCDIVVKYAPGASSLHTDTIQIDYDDGVSVVNSTRPIQGTGAVPALLTISDGATYDYGTQANGSTTDHTFTINNTGGVPASVILESGIASPFLFPGGYPGSGGNCGGTLNAGSNCTIVVQYAPSGLGVHPDTIQIDYSDGAATTNSTRPIQGTGAAPALITLSGPNPFDYGSVPITTTVPQNFTLTNSGGVSAVAMTGSGLTAPFSFPGGYPGGGTCTATLAALGTCTIVVDFNPTVTGAVSDTIQIDFNDGAGPISVPHVVDGTGIQNNITISNLVISNVSPSGFDVTVDFVGDDDADATVDFKYCNHTDTASCTPSSGATVALTRGSGVYTTQITGLTGSDDPGDIFNIEVVATDPDGVTGSPIVNNFHLQRSFIQLGLGNEQSCGVTAGSGEGFCWGRGLDGNLGNGSNTDSTTAAQVSSVTNFSNMNSHTRTTCAVGTDNAGYCWGDNAFSKFGDGTTNNSNVPVTVPGSWLKIATGSVHSCGVKTDYSAHCWGKNLNGQLGDTTVVDKTAPTLVNGSHSFTDIDVSGSFTCALKNDNTSWCWGINTNGQLGNGTATQSPVPVASTAIGSNVIVIRTGGSHTCALKTSSPSNELWCWGKASEGQIGSGATADLITPTQVGSATDWLKISLGQSHSCAINNANQLFCWGLNTDYQLGDGTTTQRNAPTLIGAGYSDVFAGYAHTCALKSGQLLCWGKNANSQLGDGLTTNIQIPTPVNP